MIYYTYTMFGLLMVFLISITILRKEVKKYYTHEREMARTNDMYIAHVSILSDLGIVCGAIAVISFIILILLYFKHIGYRGVLLILEQIGIL